MEDVIIGAWHGGLGDSLQFSTLPEEFYKQQGRKTYLWASAPFRNQGIWQLVWRYNPYVLGSKEGERTAGDLPTIEYSNVAGNCISNWEQLHGLKPTNKYPKIYYKPKTLPGYDKVYLVDFTSISINYDPSLLRRKLNEIQWQHPDRLFLEVTFNKDLSGNSSLNAYKTGLPPLLVDNIFEYYDIMASARGLVALSSGASHLSSAVKEHNRNLDSICLMDEKWYNYHVDKGNLFLFDNIDYQVI